MNEENITTGQAGVSGESSGGNMMNGVSGESSGGNMTNGVSGESSGGNMMNGVSGENSGNSAVVPENTANVGLGASVPSPAVVPENMGASSVASPAVVTENTVAPSVASPAVVPENTANVGLGASVPSPAVPMQTQYAQKIPVSSITQRENQALELKNQENEHTENESAQIKELEKALLEVAPEKKSKKKLFIILALGVAVVLGMVVLIFMLFNNSGEEVLQLGEKNTLGQDAPPSVTSPFESFENSNNQVDEENFIIPEFDNLLEELQTTAPPVLEIIDSSSSEINELESENLPVQRVTR